MIWSLLVYNTALQRETQLEKEIKGEGKMPSEKRKAKKQNYFKAAKRSRKVQQVRGEHNLFDNEALSKFYLSFVIN